MPSTRSKNKTKTPPVSNAGASIRKRQESNADESQQKKSKKAKRVPRGAEKDNKDSEESDNKDTDDTDDDKDAPPPTNTGEAAMKGKKGKAAGQHRGKKTTTAR